jgi:hypothetical protein
MNLPFKSRLATLALLAFTQPLLAAPPANDAFVNRVPITGTIPQTVSGTNIEATKESGEPNHAGYTGGKSVWWTWTAPTTGIYVINTVGSNFDTLLAVYTGTVVNALTLRASDDESGGNNTSLLSLSATSGTVYQIAVDGWNAQSGNISLTIQPPPPPPANDLFADRQVLPSNITIISGTIQGATKEAGEPNHGGNPGGRSVWYSWTAPSTGELTLQVTNNSFGPLIGVYTGSSVNSLTTVTSGSFTNTLSFQVFAATTYHIAIDGTVSGTFTLTFGNVTPPPVNDAFAARIILPGGQTTTTGRNTAATKEPSESNHAGMTGGKSVWWSWTAPSSGEVVVEIAGAAFTPLIGIYTGSTVSSLASAGPTASGVYASFAAAAGTTYHIAVDAAGTNTPGSYTLSISNPYTPPANDAFVNRTSMTGQFVKVSGHSSGATKEAGEPSHAGYTGGKSVWYRWTAPSTGTFTAYLLGNGAMANNATISVYTGASVNSLSPVASVSFGTPRTVNLSVTAGVEYQLAVDGQNSPAGSVFSGSFILSVSQAAVNNAFASATNLGSTSSGTSASWVDFAANTENGEPGHPTVFWLPPTMRTIWWKWTAPASGLFTFDTLNADFDTVLEVYSGTAVNALTLITSNHDADANGRSRVALNAVSGTIYNIRVRGETLNEIGNVTLQYAQLSTPVTADDHVIHARAHLQLQNTSAIGTADARLDSALSLDVNHPEANLLKAVTRFARLEQGTAFQSALTGLGLVDGDLYSGGHTLPKDSNGNKIATPGTHTGHGLNYLTNTVLPELTLIRAHLDKATSPSFQTSVSDTESTTRFAKIDQGDISLIKASTFLMEAMIRFLQTFDSAASMSDLITQSNAADLTAKGLRDSFSNLLSNTGNNQRTSFKTALQNANTHYQAGSAFIRTTRANAADEKHLFYLSANNTARESEVRTRAQEASAALDGPAILAGESVDLSIAITSSQALRDRLPGLVGNKAVASTSPDPTFGGAAPGMTQAKLNGRLRKLGILHEVSSFGNWTQHYLSSLPPSSQDKNDDPDGDMLSNFAEFAFHLDPARVSSSSEFAVGGLETNVVDNKPYLNIIFRRRIVRDMVNYIVAVSDDLVSWDRTQAQVVQVGPAAPNADGITETIKFRVVADPDITERKFVRVEAVDLAP